MRSAAANPAARLPRTHAAGTALICRAHKLNSKPTRAPLPPPRAAGVEPTPSGAVGSTYDGAYGRWTYTSADAAEVWAYRASLVAAAGGFVAAVAHPAVGTPAAVVTAGGLAAATTLIHIYVTPIKRALQALAVAGAVGTAVAAASAGDAGVPAAVAADGSLIWLVGPTAAAATGVAIKEGLCYAKPDAAVLAAALPAACLAHLSGFVPPSVETGLTTLAAATAAVFAARKLVQPPVDDVGDKSVFEFRALPPDEQAARLAALARQAAFLEGEE